MFVGQAGTEFLLENCIFWVYSGTSISHNLLTKEIILFLLLFVFFFCVLGKNALLKKTKEKQIIEDCPIEDWDTYADYVNIEHYPNLCKSNTDEEQYWIPYKINGILEFNKKYWYFFIQIFQNTIIYTFLWPFIDIHFSLSQQVFFYKKKLMFL